MLYKYKRKIALLFLLVMIGYSSYSTYSIWAFSKVNQLVKSDAAIVLGAAVWGKEPSPVFRERINHSIWLYENGYVDKIIYTGGSGNGDNYAESVVAREYAIKHHVQEEDIFIEAESKITEENLQYAKEIAAKKNLETFIIVSDPLHMKRAMLMAEYYQLDAYASPTQTSAYKTFNSKLPFLLRELFYYIGFQFSMPFR